MSKKAHRKPAAFTVEEVEVFAPAGGAGFASEPAPLPAPRAAHACRISAAGFAGARS